MGVPAGVGEGPGPSAERLVEDADAARLLALGQAVTAARAELRTVGEQTMVTPKGRRLLRCGTTGITDLVRTVLTLRRAPA
ncbi:hypothetical protein RB196_08770 [Streptomyces sp. PmtA]|uniref:hypothetical protein n=1 Tax=Streptomyces sp. PmtA TaxID=3074275 RepID=UPI0030143FFC